MLTARPSGNTAIAATELSWLPSSSGPRSGLLVEQLSPLRNDCGQEIPDAETASAEALFECARSNGHPGGVPAVSRPHPATPPLVDPPDAYREDALDGDRDGDIDPERSCCCRPAEAKG